LHVCVAEELDLGAVVGVQDGLQKVRHRMRADVGRDVADPQPAAGLGRVGVAAGGQLQRGVLAGPAEAFLVDFTGSRSQM